MTHTTSFRRVLCLFLVLMILTVTIATPVCASAVLLEVLAASARSMIASVIRACGVYVADGLATEFTTAINNFESLTDSALSYVYERVPDYFKLVNATGALMLKMVLKDSKYYVPRTIVDNVCDFLVQEYCDSEYYDYASQFGFKPTSYFDYEDFNKILSDANFCGYDVSSCIDSYDFQYCYFIHVTPTSTHSGSTYWGSPALIFINDTSKIKIKQSGERMEIKIAANTPYAVMYNEIDSVYDGMTFKAETLRFDWADTLSFECQNFDYYVIERQAGSSGLSAPGLEGISFENDAGTVSSSWSSQGITVTDDKLGNSAVTMVPVSVHPVSSAATISRSEAQAGTVVDAETATVEDEVLGDVTTETGFWSSVLDWLSRILSAIKSLVAGITVPIVNAVERVLAGVDSLVKFFTGTTFVASPLDAIAFDGLFDLFPFNIPYGIYQAISFWDAGATAPVITIPLPTYSGGSVDIYEFQIDFSEIPGMSTLVSIVRGGELILFAVGLLMITRKVTKW